MFTRIADALAHAHEQLVVHRDIKPGNVLVDAHDHAHLLDFGIAGRLQPTADDPKALGPSPRLTPEFAAPEQLTGGRVGVRSDIHALGGLLYFLLTARPPRVLHGLSGPALVQHIGTSRPPALVPHLQKALRQQAPHGLHADLDAIIAKAMDSSIEARYGSVDAMLRDLHAAQAHLPISARPARRVDRLRRGLRRNRAAVGVGTLLLLSLLAGFASTAWQAHRAARQRDLAEAQARTANAVRDFMVGVFRAANPDIAAGDMPTALELLDAGVARIRHDLHGQPQLQAELFAALGDTYIGLGRYPQAQALLLAAMQQADAALPANAATAQRLLLGYARAVSLAGGPYEPLQSRLRQSLALPLADDTQSRAVAIELRAHHGGVLFRTGQLDAAARELDAAVRQARALGDAGRHTLVTALQQQVQLHVAQARRPEAVAGLREIVALLDRKPQRSGSDRQAALEQLADVLGTMGRGDEAIGLLREVRQHHLTIYGPEHPASISSGIGLARAMLRREQYPQSRALMEQMLALALRVHGENSDITALARTNLAALEYQFGNNRAAIALMEQVQRHAIERHGARSPRALLMLQNLARVRLDDDDLEGARHDLEQLLAGLQATNADAVAEPLALLGDIARQQGRPARARELHRQALDSYARLGDASSFDVQDHRLSLAQDERDLGNLDAARGHARQGLDGLLQLDAQANAGMVGFARYLLAQLDVLEQRCGEDGLHALNAIREQQLEQYRGQPVPDNVRWRLQRIDLYLGLCRQQRQPSDMQAQELVRTAAIGLLDSRMTDPHTRQLARRQLRR